MSAPDATGPARGQPARASAGAPPVLAAREIGRRFGGVVALDGVSLEARAGQVTCLLGDNGAGKSTLIKVLAGVHPPTTGAVEVDGVPVELRSPRQAQRLGIATVYQDLAVIPLMSVWRNFFLGREPVIGRGPFRRLDATSCRRMTREALRSFAIDLDDVDRPLATLSGGERQSVAIARAVHAGARALILDEPTAALGVRQSRLVLDHVRRVREAGVAIVLVTHNPQHALEVGDRFIILRSGRIHARASRRDASLAGLVEGMSGV